MLRDLWQHRVLVASLVRRHFQLRSSRAVWGHAWLVIQPALQILIYTLIFSAVLSARLPGDQDPFAYGLYVCAGLITWNYFADVISRSQTLFIENAELLRTVRVPRSALPLSLVLTSTLQFAVVAFLFGGLLCAIGRWPGMVMLQVFPLLLCQLMLAVGLGVLTATLNVFFRDVGEAVAIALQFGFWLTPIVYPLSIVPAPFSAVLEWNPMAHLVGSYQGLVLEGVSPDWDVIAVVAAAGGAVCVLSWVVFRSLSADLVDEI
jgi:lipopolysaccharide transport system permease protein